MAQEGAASALNRVVRSRWYAHEPEASGTERRLPDVGLCLIVNLEDDRLGWADGPALDRWHSVAGIGIARTSTVVGLDRADQRRVMGWELRPGAARCLFGVPAAALDQPIVELRDVWGSEATFVRERLLECPTPAAARALLAEVLLDHLDGQPDPWLTPAMAALTHRPVAEVVHWSGVSRSTFVRRLRQELGIGPKRLQRLNRFTRLVGSIDTSSTASQSDWAELAAEHGYADQSHLIAEFRDFAGLTPTAYLRAVRPSALHVAGG